VFIGTISPYLFQYRKTSVIEYIDKAMETVRYGWLDVDN